MAEGDVLEVDVEEVELVDVVDAVDVLILVVNGVVAGDVVDDGAVVRP